jgi:hypothetical protein
MSQEITMKRLQYAAATGLFLLGCAATQLTSTWRDPNFQPSAPKKVVVMAVLNNNTIRRRVEDAFVKQLADVGVKGVPSYSFLQDKKPGKDQLIQKVKNTGANLVIITTLKDRKTTQTYVPPTESTTKTIEPGFYGYYSTQWDTTYTPGYTITSQQAISEIKAFDVADEKLVWSGTASTVVDNRVSDALIAEFAKKVTRSIFKNRRA